MCEGRSEFTGQSFKLVLGGRDDHDPMAVVERRVVEHPEPCAEILGGIAAVREARIDAANRFGIECLRPHA